MKNTAANEITTESAVQSFEDMVRRFCPVTLGGVDFWIDSDGPWAGQLSFSVPTSNWDKEKVSAELTAKLNVHFHDAAIFGEPLPGEQAA